MSGHSHYATIKRQKETKDAQRGKLFSKLTRAISIAVKTGGGPDPESNHRLRMAIEAAKVSNMPKSNIDRALKKASKGGGSVEEVKYEGYGPGGIAVLVEVATDNRNRTAQEIKNVFEKWGGSLGGPGSVSYNFQPKGLLVIKKKGKVEEQMLQLIDFQTDDVEETADGIEVYCTSDNLHILKDELEKGGFTVNSADLIQKPKTLNTINDEKSAKRALSFMEAIEEHEDVLKVFTNLDIPQEILDSVSKEQDSI